jgi:hypothetical protein
MTCKIKFSKCWPMITYRCALWVSNPAAESQPSTTVRISGVCFCISLSLFFWMNSKSINCEVAPESSIYSELIYPSTAHLRTMGASVRRSADIEFSKIC